MHPQVRQLSLFLPSTSLFHLFSERMLLFPSFLLFFSPPTSRPTKISSPSPSPRPTSRPSPSPCPRLRPTIIRIPRPRLPSNTNTNTRPSRIRVPRIPMRTTTILVTAAAGSTRSRARARNRPYVLGLASRNANARTRKTHTRARYRARRRWRGDVGGVLREFGRGVAVDPEHATRNSKWNDGGGREEELEPRTRAVKTFLFFLFPSFVCTCIDGPVLNSPRRFPCSLPSAGWPSDYRHPNRL